MNETQYTADPIEDIGSGIRIQRRYVDGQLVGLDWYHACGPEDRPGWVPVGGAHGWKLEETQPLTLSPSILCNLCGRHGFIHDGKWLSS